MSDKGPVYCVRVQVDRRTTRDEVLLVLGLSLGASAVYSIVTLIARLTAGPPLAQQTATLNRSESDRPWLDLTLQLLNIFFALVPALLVVHLLRTEPGGPRAPHRTGGGPGPTACPVWRSR